jgi:ferrous iron transport protein A
MMTGRKRFLHQRLFRRRGEGRMSKTGRVSDDKEISPGPSGAGGRRSLTLDLLPPGAEGRVLSVNGAGPVARRLMEMGVVPGAPVRVVKFAPLGDPLEVRVRDYHLALRRNEAQTIAVVMSDE